MTKKRIWNKWYRRFVTELNLTSGLISLGGIVLSVIGFLGWNSSSGLLAILVGSSGIAIAIIAVAIPAYRAIPPKLRNCDELVGQRLSLDKLEEVDPPPLKLGVVGPSQVGKSTLLMRILHKVPSSYRTDTLHARIAALNTEPFQYVALLDAPGETFAKQFQVATPADILLILIDHHRSENRVEIDENRMREHKEFQRQLRGYLREQDQKPILIHLLLNKQDLWEKNTLEECVKLKKFLTEEEKAWKDSNLVLNVTSSEHSNERSGNVTQLVCQIEQLLNSLKS